MEPNVENAVKIAEDSDFENLKQLIDDHTGWAIDYDKATLKVWTKNFTESNYKMVKMHATFNDVSASTMYDVLHDPDYRKQWDPHMLESYDIGYLNPNNDVGYYAMSCPSPLKNRDFVLQRSWLDLGKEKYIISHSVPHKDYPVKKGFVRAHASLTGYLVRSLGPKSSFLGYVSQTNPQGKLPPWMVNRATQSFGPKIVKTIYEAAKNYDQWKMAQPNPTFRPWLNPEQMQCKRISISEVNGHFLDRMVSIITS